MTKSTLDVVLGKHLKRLDELRSDKETIEGIVRIALGKMDDPERRSRFRGKNKDGSKRFYACGSYDFSDGPFNIGVLVGGHPNVENYIQSVFHNYVSGIGILHQAFGTHLTLRTPRLIGLLHIKANGYEPAIVTEDFGFVDESDKMHHQGDAVFEFTDNGLFFDAHGSLVAGDFDQILVRKAYHTMWYALVSDYYAHPEKFALHYPPPVKRPVET